MATAAHPRKQIPRHQADTLNPDTRKGLTFHPRNKAALIGVTVIAAVAAGAAEIVHLSEQAKIGRQTEALKSTSVIRKGEIDIGPGVVLHSEPAMILDGGGSTYVKTVPKGHLIRFKKPLEKEGAHGEVWAGGILSVDDPSSLRERAEQTVWFNETRVIQDPDSNITIKDPAGVEVSRQQIIVGDNGEIQAAANGAVIAGAATAVETLIPNRLSSEPPPF